MVATTWGGVALAQEPPAKPAPPIERPDFARMPTGRDIARYFPRAAERNMVSGAAVISCEVTAEGLLTACRVLEETPPGYGFGEAALKMGPIFKLRPISKDGQPVAGRTVRIPIQMRVW